MIGSQNDPQQPGHDPECDRDQESDQDVFLASLPRPQRGHAFFNDPVGARDLTDSGPTYPIHVNNEESDHKDRSGHGKDIHWTKEISVPVNSRIIPAAITFGGVPTMVAMPPREQPYAVVNISAVPYRGLISDSDSMKASRDKPIGKSMAAVAVLLIHAEMNAAIPP